MTKRDAKGIVRRALGMALNKQGLDFSQVYSMALGSDLPEDMQLHDELLDECLFEVIDWLQDYSH